MRTTERTETPTRAAVVKLLRNERSWRKFFRTRCGEGVSRLWAGRYEFRAELQKRGEWHDREEIGDVLLALAREKLPEAAAARWDAEWASRLCRGALARLGERYTELTEDERARLNLEPQDHWHDRMNEAGEENDPAAFRQIGFVRQSTGFVMSIRVKWEGCGSWSKMDQTSTPRIRAY